MDLTIWFWLLVALIAMVGLVRVLRKSIIKVKVEARKITQEQEHQEIKDYLPAFLDWITDHGSEKELPEYLKKVRRHLVHCEECREMYQALNMVQDDPEIQQIWDNLGKR